MHPRAAEALCGAPCPRAEEGLPGQPCEGEGREDARISGHQVRVLQLVDLTSVYGMSQATFESMCVRCAQHTGFAESSQLLFHEKEHENWVLCGVCWGRGRC